MLVCWWCRRTPSLRLRERRRGSPVGVPRREEAIETALANKLADRAAKRELEAARAAKEIEEFSNEFLNAARKCFDLIDVDCSGTLTKAEMSARCVRPSTCARRGDGARSAAVHTPSTRFVAHRPIPAQRHRRQSG